jgi:hypothetical protein
MTESAHHPRSPAVSLQIIGIHVGGVANQKSSLVRARCVVREFYTGLSDAALHGRLLSRLQQSISGIPGAAPGSQFDSEAPTAKNSPLFWEAFSSDLGPVAHQDADTRLLEAISDLGGAQIFCLDAPLTFPQCTTCSRACPTVPLCPEPAVQGMMELWKEDKDTEAKRPRMPLPHTERFFEAYARRRYQVYTYATGAHELENVLSSNKAPLAARAHHLARRLKTHFPNALIVETHPWLAAVGWALHCGYRLNHSAELRQPDSGRIARAGLLKKLELSRTALRSAVFVEDLFLELSDHVEIFAATMAAMSGWGLINGLCDIQPSFLNQAQTDLLQGWALVPRELATYGWGH